jgi:hypothetical protein
LAFGIHEYSKGSTQNCNETSHDWPSAKQIANEGRVVGDITTGGGHEISRFGLLGKSRQLPQL